MVIYSFIQNWVCKTANENHNFKIKTIFFFQRVEYYLKDKHISRNNIQSAAHIMRHSFSDK